MSPRLRIEGGWPAPVTLSRGWARANARPWNDETSDAFLRLARGSHDFLAAASEDLVDLSRASVYSPALYPSSTRIWKRCGYEETFHLNVMERSVTSNRSGPTTPIDESRTPDWHAIMEIDRLAFQGFWRMSLAGLMEAMASTTRSVVLTVGDTETVGYAIVGAQWNVSYLQRIAVHPEHTGKNIGSDLVRAALAWARRTAAQTMVLNIREENVHARRLYSKEGFVLTGAALRILRYEV
ncbi:MAG: GNAT family N-acetyltransferase [Acidimicrobiia bacterium]